MVELYAGLRKYSCDMCGLGPRPFKTVTHRDGSKVDICDSCYRGCLAHPEFQEGVKTGQIKVENYPF